MQPFLFFAAMAFCLGLSFYYWRRARVIEDTPTAKVRSAPQGYIELTGFARPVDGQVLYAPLSGVPCVWYSFRVERKNEGHGNSNQQWEVIRRGRSEYPFNLQDETGSCVVQPDQAEVSCAEMRWRGNTPQPLHGADQYRALSVTAQLMGASHEYRYIEERIADGDWIYVAGFFETLNPASAELQSKALMKDLLSQWKLDNAALLERFDQNGDGQIDLQEWEQARLAAAQQAHKEVLHNFDHSPLHFMTHSPNRNQPYLISSRDPKLLTAKYRRHAFLYLGIGAALGLAGFRGLVLLPY